jgi:regulator-associated protein of mTOR
MDSTSSSVILGLGTGAGIRDMLPLKSTFFDWCCEYFKEPQMRVRVFDLDFHLFCAYNVLQQAEPDEPGSVQYNYQVWRQQRNEQINNETQTQAAVAGMYYVY